MPAMSGSSPGVVGLDDLRFFIAWRRFSFFCCFSCLLRSRARLFCVGLDFCIVYSAFLRIGAAARTCSGGNSMNNAGGISGMTFSTIQQSGSSTRSADNPDMPWPRKIFVVLLICFSIADARALAAEPASTLLAVAVRETARLARLETEAAPTQGKQRSGHPVLISAAIGAAALGAAAYATASCSVPPPDDVAACGSHYKAGLAFLGAGIGAGVGALVGLAFRH